MSFHGPIEPAPDHDPVSVYWTPVDQVLEVDATVYLQAALVGRSDRESFVFLQAGVFETAYASPLGYFDAAMNDETGEVCGLHVPYDLDDPIWTAARPGDHSDAIQQLHDRLVERGRLASFSTD